MKLARRHPKRGRVEIIPMIDTILILLIFYMSFSSFTQTEKRIDARLPRIAKAGAVAPTEVPLDITLHVRDKDNILVNNSAVFDMFSLVDAMRGLAAIGQQATVVIEAEAETPYADVIGALDACAQARLTKVAFRPIETQAAPTP
jgi:biopolymer transport protein ExbD